LAAGAGETFGPAATAVAEAATAAVLRSTRDLRPDLVLRAVRFLTLCLLTRDAPAAVVRAGFVFLPDPP
jgi:hypothetical protein